MVLDGAPLLGLRTDPDEHVLREESVRFRVRCRSEQARHRDAEERQRRPAPDLADSPEEQDVWLLQLRAAEHRALDAGQHDSARRVEPAELSPEPHRDGDVPLHAQPEDALRGGDGQPDRDLDARAGRRLEDVQRTIRSQSRHGHQFPRLRRHVLAQLHVGPLVSQLAVVRARLARLQVRIHAGGRPGGPPTLHDARHLLIVRTGQPFQVTVRTTPYIDARAAGRRPWRLRAGHLDHQAADGQRRPSLGLLEQQGRGAGSAGRHLDWPAAASRRMTNVPNYKDLAPRLGRGLRPVRQWQDGGQGHASRYVQTSTVGDRAPAQSAQHVGQQRQRGRGRMSTATDSAVRERVHYPSVGCELGALTNNAFGQVNVATRYDPDTITGWGKRRNNWEVSASVTQELMARSRWTSRTSGARRDNFTTTDNLDVAPADFDPYCVTAPTDSRLPERRRAADLRPLRHHRRRSSASPPTTW